MSKRCFCINADNKDMPYILDKLKLNDEPTSKEPKVDDYRFLLTPHIGKVSDKDDKYLSIINDLMSIQLKKMDYDDVRPSNEKVDVAPRNSMTVEAPNPGPEDSDDIDLNTMARTSNVEYRGIDNMGIFEDFNCDDKCSKNTKVKGLFETVEAKYLLFVIALLLMCSIIFRK
jgi:hypothetical protein